MKSFLYATFAFVGLSIAGMSALHAETLYWNGGNASWNLSGTGANVWSTADTGTGTLYWVNGDDAVITSVNPTISLYSVNVNNLTIQNGAALTSGGSNGHIINVSGAGSGNFTLQDNSTNNASMKFDLIGTTGWDGTITVKSFVNATSGLVLGNQASTDTTAGTGSSTSTKIAMSGGLMYLGFGTMTTGTGGTATIGELSGNGTISLLANSAAGGKTRVLQVDQATNTTFRGLLGTDLTVNYSTNLMGFSKAGTGTLVVTSASGSATDSGGAYGGTTTVSGGKLYFTGSYGLGYASTTGQGKYIVKNGATLGFNGTINFATNAANSVTVENGGILDPGSESGTGTWTIAGGNASSLGLVFLGTANFEFTLGATAQDSIILTNTSMIGSAAGGVSSLLFDFTNLDASAGSTYDLISFGGTTQGIALDRFGLSQASLDNGWSGTFQYGGDGNTLQFAVTAVPEPGVISMLFFGAGLFLICRLQRKRLAEPVS